MSKSSNSTAKAIIDLHSIIDNHHNRHGIDSGHRADLVLIRGMDTASCESVITWLQDMAIQAPNLLADNMLAKDEQGNTALLKAVLMGRHEIAGAIMHYLETHPQQFKQWLRDDARQGKMVTAEWMLTCKTPLLLNVLAFMQTCTVSEQKAYLGVSQQGLSLLHIAIMDRFAIEWVLNAYIAMGAHHLLTMFDPSRRCPLLWLIKHYQPQYQQALMQFFSESDTAYWDIQTSEGDTVLQLLAKQISEHPHLADIFTKAMQRLAQDERTHAIAYANHNARHMVDYVNDQHQTLADTLAATRPQFLPLLQAVQTNYQAYQLRMHHRNLACSMATCNEEKQQAEDSKWHRFFLNHSQALPHTDTEVQYGENSHARVISNDNTDQETITLNDDADDKQYPARCDSALVKAREQDVSNQESGCSIVKERLSPTSVVQQPL